MTKYLNIVSKPINKIGDDDTVNTYAISKDFRGFFDKKILSVDFTMCGNFFAMTRTPDDFIIIYRTESGDVLDQYVSMPVGKDIFRFTRNNNLLQAFHTSNNYDHSIRCVDLEDGSCFGYYSGHSQPVKSIDLKPSTDIFITGSIDQTMRIWDVRLNANISMLRFTETPTVAISPTSATIAISTEPQKVNLYDMRELGKGPFKKFYTGLRYMDKVTAIKFSPNGQKLLLSSDTDSIEVFNITANENKIDLEGFANIFNSPQEASWMMDGIHVLCGNHKGCVLVWNSNTGNKVCEFQPNYPRLITRILVNPKFRMFATTGQKLDFWEPLRSCTVSKSD